MRKSKAATLAPDAESIRFQSYFMAGFECATGGNVGRQAIDQIAATQHDTYRDADFRMITEVGMRTIREGIRWPHVDKKGKLDFSEVEQVIEAANQHRIELILDLFHYGIPEDLDIFSGSF